MQSIESIDAVGAADMQRMQRARVAPPESGAERITLESTSSAHPLDVVSGMRSVEQNLALNQRRLLATAQDVQRTGGSLSSLTLLQLRVSEYSITHQVLSSTVSSLNQSLRTVLNAA